ncbi:MAG: hypothetical protein ORN29_06140 [Rhodoferax sp.]|nr:hypothetical protein [Rhodoferax sp.]
MVSPKKVAKKAASMAARPLRHARKINPRRWRNLNQIAADSIRRLCMATEKKQFGYEEFSAPTGIKIICQRKQG